MMDMLSGLTTIASCVPFVKRSMTLEQKHASMPTPILVKDQLNVPFQAAEEDSLESTS